MGLDIFKTKFDDLIHVAASDSAVRVKESERWSLLCIQEKERRNVQVWLQATSQTEVRPMIMINVF